LFPPILDEFHWDRGVTAGAFSFGFVISAFISPTIGRMMDRFGPRAVTELGTVSMAAGFLLAPFTTQPWHLYLTLGVLVGGGSVCLGYAGQSLFLPNWFVRSRGLAIGLAFSGVGLGSITLLPWVQSVIIGAGWRDACRALGLLILIVLTPINLLLRKRPEDMGLLPDGDAAPLSSAPARISNVVDPYWASIDWTVRRAVRTARFWWLALGYFGALYAWYAVQVHQTKYLQEIGFTANRSAWALGLVSLIGVAGQISLGHVSDRIGREWIWAVSMLGFVICFLAVSDGRRSGWPWLRPDFGHGRDGRRNIPGPAVRRHLRDGDAGGDGGRRGRSMGHRRAARRIRQLHAGILGWSLCERRVRIGDLAGVTKENSRRGGEGSAGLRVLVTGG
jgi:MFS family permease